jgi:hypothetical protein
MPLQSTYQPPDQFRQQPNYIHGYQPSRQTSGLFTLGLVALGLGALAWYYMGPDLRRYIKISSM